MERAAARAVVAGDERAVPCHQPLRRPPHPPDGNRDLLARGPARRSRHPRLRPAGCRLVVLAGGSGLPAHRFRVRLGRPDAFGRSDAVRPGRAVGCGCRRAEHGSPGGRVRRACRAGLDQPVVRHSRLELTHPAAAAGKQGAAHGVVERVAGGEAAAIQKQLGGNAFRLVVDSFVPGMRAALLVAGILMLLASAGAFLALRPPRSRRSAGG